MKSSGCLPMIEEGITPCKQFLFLTLSNCTIQAESFNISIRKIDWIGMQRILRKLSCSNFHVFYQYSIQLVEYCRYQQVVKQHPIVAKNCIIRNLMSKFSTPTSRHGVRKLLIHCQIKIVSKILFISKWNLVLFAPKLATSHMNNLESPRKCWLIWWWS